MFTADENTQRLTARFSHLVSSERGTTTVRQMARALSTWLGDRCEVGDAARYIFHFARTQGYKIPPYPMAGNGQFKEFLADEGVADIPGWYAKLGVDADLYVHLPERTAVVVRTAHFARKLIVMDGLYHRNDTGFVTLAESGLVEHLDDGHLGALLDEMFDVLEPGFASEYLR